MIQPVILCGGSDTSPWLFPRSSFQNQLIPLVGNRIFLQLTLEFVVKLNSSDANSEDNYITGEDNGFLMAEAIQAAKVKGLIILNPRLCAIPNST